MSSYIQGGQKYIQANQYWQLPEVGEYRFVEAGSVGECFFKDHDGNHIMLHLRNKMIYKVIFNKEPNKIYETLDFLDERPINFKNKKEKELYRIAKNEYHRTFERINCNVQ